MFAKKPLPGGLETSGPRAMANIGLPLKNFGFCCFNNFMRFDFFWVFWALQTSLLCIMGELAGRGCVALAVGT